MGMKQFSPKGFRSLFLSYKFYIFFSQKALFFFTYNDVDNNLKNVNGVQSELKQNPW